MAERTVNERQREVLQWIVDGCPDGVMTGTTHKTTALALQGRRLVTVTKRRGAWKAEATAAGRHFIEHGAYPDGHWAAAAKQSEAVATPRQPQSGRPTVAGECRRVTGKRPVQQLVEDVIAVGGSLEVEDGDGHYNNLVSAASRYGTIPEGKLLRIKNRRGWREKTIELVDKPAWMTAVLDPIPVPERLTKPHPGVAALRSDREHRLRFNREVRQRALRILQAVASEASKRGWDVTCPAWERHQRNPVGDLLISVSGHPHALHVSEDTDKVPHQPTATELRNNEKWGRRIPKYDKVPSGRLSIAINGGIPVRQSSFGDTKTLDLVDRLPILLQEIELRAAGAEERRLEREREEAERRRQWEQVRDDAIIALREHNRAEVLTRQAESWRQHELHGEYLTALEAHVKALEDEHRAEAAEWLEWAKKHHQRSDPFDKSFAIPPNPEPTAEAIKPFMRGLSPYGPDSYRRW